MAFATKAAELARQYGIDPASLDPDKIGEHPHRAGKRFVPTWQGFLAEGAARLNDCTTLLQGGRVLFVGRKGDCITAELMFDYFKGAANQAVALHLRDYQGRRPRAAANAFRNSFSAEILRRAAAAVPSAPESRREIVEFIASLRPEKARSRSVRGSYHGREAAQGVGLNRQAMGAAPLAIAGAA